MSQGPLTETLELDIAAALDSLGTFGTALEATVTEFRSGLEAALETIGSATVEVPVVADVDEAQADISGLEADEVTIPVEADTEAVQLTLSGLEAEAVTVEVDADVTAAENRIDGLEADPVVAEVELDTTSAEGALDDLTSDAGDAGSALGVAQDQSQLLAVSTGLAAGEVGELANSLRESGGAAGAAAAGFAILGGFTAAIVSNAIDADTASRRLNQTLGSQADAFNSIGIEGFAKDLDELAVKTGNSDESLRLAASRLAELGKSAGATQENIGTTAENMALLATRLSVVNPTLGDAGAIADRLTNAFARGGRALAPFGIALTSTQINARALADTGKDTADQLTIYEKAAAGAAIATEQLGDALKRDIVDASAAPEIQLRALKTQLDEFLESLGTPLIVPSIELLRDLLPVAESIGRVLGASLRATLPLLTAFGPALQVVAFALNGLAAAIERIPEPLLTAVAGLVAFQLALRAIETARLITAIFILTGGFTGVAAAEGAATAGAGAFATAIRAAWAAALGPVGLVVAGLAIVAKVLGVFDGQAEEAAQASKELDAALFGTAASAQQLGEAVSGVNVKVRGVLAELFGSTEEGQKNARTMGQLGVSYEALADGISGTDTEMLDFIKRLQDQQQATGTSKGATDDLIESLYEQRNILQATAASRFEAVIAEGELTEAQIAQARAAGQLNDALVGTFDASGNYIAALDEATKLAAANQKATLEQALATGTLQQAFRDLRPAIAAGTVTTASAQEVADQLGISLADAEAAIESLSTAMDQFVQQGVSQLPGAGDAIADFASGIDSAFGALVSVAGADTSGIDTAIRNVATTRDEVNRQISETGRDTAQAIAEAERKIAEAQAQVDRTGSAADVQRVKDAQADLAKARAEGADKQAKAIEDGNRRIGTAQQSVTDQQNKQTEEARAAQDAYLRAIDPQRVIDQQFANTLSIVRFQENLTTLLRRGRDDAVALLIATGPEQGAALAQALVNDDAKAKALEGGTELAGQVGAGYKAFLEEHKSELSGKTVTLANGLAVDLTDTFSSGIGDKLSGAITDGLGLTSEGLKGPLTRSQLVELEKRQKALEQVKTQAEAAGTAATSGFTETFKIEKPTTDEMSKVAPAITAGIPGGATAATAGAKAVTAAWAQGLKITAATSTAFAGVNDTVETLSGVAARTATIGGFSVGVAFIDGMTAGLSDADANARLNAAGAAPAEVLVKALKTALGIKSPSTVGFGIGRDFIAGIVGGLAPGSVSTAAGAIVGALTVSPDAARLAANRTLVAAGTAAPTAPAAAAPTAAVSHTEVTKSVDVKVELHRVDPDPHQLSRDIAWNVAS